MSGRNAYAAGVGAFPLDIWDAWYGPYSLAPGTPPTGMGNAMPLGTRIDSYDDYWGWGEFVLMQFQTASTAVPTGTLVTWDTNYIISAVPNTANLAYPVGVVSSNFLSDASVGALTAPWNQQQTTNQLYGWVQIAGQAPVSSITTTAAGPAFISATAGLVTSTAAAGKEVLNFNSKIGSAGAFSRYGVATVLGNTINGRTEVFVNDKTGLFPGMTLSGTGIPANATITDMQTGRNNSILISAAATTSGAVTITPAYTGASTFFVIAMFDRPFMQGQIT